MLFRQALFSSEEASADTVYSYLSKDTKQVFEERVSMMNEMSEQIVRFLPQVDQKLARKQTGAVLLKEQKLTTGKDLFKLLYSADLIKPSDELEVGSEISDIEYLNDENTEAILVTYAKDEYRLVLEEDGVWRVASWREFAKARTAWISNNREILEQTIQELITEEKEEIDKVIAYLLEQGKAKKGKVAK